MKLPHEIEQKMLEILKLPNMSKRNVPSYTNKLSKIRTQMHTLSHDFARLKSTEEKYADAYFAYNFPMNVMKVMTVAKEFQNIYSKLFSHTARLNILDVGCGDGAGMLGLYYRFKDANNISLTGIDASSLMLKRTQELMGWLKSHDPSLDVKLMKRKISPNLFKKTKQQYDIILFANALAEIFSTDKISLTFIEQILKCTTRDGIVIIIEPALKKFSRRLMNLRTEIIKTEKSSILLPCLHEYPCALLNVRKHREWCHQSVPWEPPDFMKIINRGLNREIDHLKFSYLVIAKKNYKKSFCNGFRVISHVLKEKGKKRCFLCNQNRRVELVRLNKSKNTFNTPFDEISKGDIIALKRVIQKKLHYWQIEGNTEVKILTKAKG
ncbi:MAG: methyltransferase domain-containing protein [candidate division WOR-3 bacterium]|nr:MAG: methyltransferase domain-containing protein [candidate division WOR-3 bacterium]